MGRKGRNRPRRATAATLLAIAAALALPAAAFALGGIKNSRHWHPPPTTAAWQWQLRGEVNPELDAWVYDIDGAGARKSDVRAIHRRRHRAVCQLELGTWKGRRPDAGRFPRAAIGRPVKGSRGARWLDVSRFRSFQKPLERRIRGCARKRFDAVAPDHLDAWEPEHRTGFRISSRDQLRFNRWLAGQVHGRGMAIALRNDARQARRLVGDFDFAIVERCFERGQCGRFLPFTRRGKAVFAVEYGIGRADFCARAEQLGFSAIRKSTDLAALPWEPCDPLGPEPSA